MDPISNLLLDISFGLWQIATQYVPVYYLAASLVPFVCR